MPDVTDNERQRLLDDLKGVVKGDVFTSQIFTELYATDASLYQVTPSAIVRPASTADVVQCIKYAANHNLPVTARGAGTGLAGESLGRGIVLDFSQSMRKIIERGKDFVSVQPGVVLGNLNRMLSKQDLHFGPDPSTRNVTTMGGVIAIDSSGSHFLKYGSARSKVLGLQVVLPDGEVIETSEAHIHSGEHNRFRKSEITNALSEIIDNNWSTIEKHSIRKVNNRSGYNLLDCRKNPKRIDLNPLFCGSEGTLGIVTAATLKLDPVPSHRGVVLFFFEKLDRAMAAIPHILEQNPSACDLMDRRLLNLTRETERMLADTIPVMAEYMILSEIDGDSAAEIDDRINSTIRIVQRLHGHAFHSVSTTDPRERNQYWRIVRRVVTRLSRVSGSSVSVPFVEDMAVPPERLHEFIVGAQKIFRDHRVTASIFSHAGHGQTHFRPFLDTADRSRMEHAINSISGQLSSWVLDCGGTISGEHGDGMSRSWFLKKQFGPLQKVFNEVKRLFDPSGMLNPGKKAGEIDQLPSDQLRNHTVSVDQNSYDNPTASSKKSGSLPIFEPHLPWSIEEMSATVQTCNGCGRCRTSQPHERMCPIFRMLPSEEASPRAKANLMRGVLNGHIDLDQIASEEFKKVADLCVNCHQCREECPAEVNIPRLMLEAKSQHVSRNGLNLSQWLLSQLDLLCKIGSRFSWMTNFLNRSRFFRWLLEKTTGIAEGRKLPRFEGGSFLKRAHKQKLTTRKETSGPKVAYFVDAVPNWIDKELSEALLHVMKKNGIEVYVPPAQSYSGLSLISNGLVEKATRLARRNVEIFAEAIRAGYHVVTTEPAAALCLTYEYPNLLEKDDDDARLVAANSSEICHYLWKLHKQDQLNTDFQEVHATVGYHWPCHQKALSNQRPGFRLLNLIPGLNVIGINEGCSGMAGTFGLLKQNYRKSLRAGWGLISNLRRTTITSGTTECSACKMQMEQGTSKPTFHPLKILAHAYGFLPDLPERMNATNHDRFIAK